MSKDQKELCADIDNKEASLFTLIMTNKVDQTTWIQTMEALMDADPRSANINSQIKLYKRWRRKHLSYAYDELNRAERANKCLQMLRTSFSSDRGNNNE